jgi:nucleotide-binding universal stress UspA family protein
MQSLETFMRQSVRVKTALEYPIASRFAIKRDRQPAAISRAPRQKVITNILVPIDFSRGSLKAIPYALAISRQFGATVHLLHVVDTSQYLPPTLLTLPLVPQTELNRQLLKRLQAVALKFSAAGKIEVHNPPEGRAYEEICAAARQLKTDLIVIATHGYTGYKRTFLGSTAERVVQHSPCPVLVVRHHHRSLVRSNGQVSPTGFQPRRILIPLDFSDCSQAAFDYGLQIARDLGAGLTLLHVVNPHHYHFGHEYAALDASGLMAAARDSSRKQMWKIVKKTNLRCSVEVKQGSPAMEICKYANKKVDLIIISTHGRSGLRHALIGSTAERVVRHADGPVLVVPARRKRPKKLTN